MQKKKNKFGIAMFLLFVPVFILSGCSDQNQEQTQNQSINQDQPGIMEQKRDGSGEGQGRMVNPPAELTEACSGKAEGDSCESVMPSRNREDNSEERKITGVCQKIGENEVLSCRPEMPQGEMKRDNL